tara:strand:- start:337 stop:591 length:255 start_codon:yes stop_codon:yes gene_type:complete
MAEYRVISSSVGASYTGSIAKVQALNAAGTLARVEWGNFTYPESAFTPTNVIDENIVVPAGTVIEGPIGRLKVGAAGFLIYINV